MRRKHLFFFEAVDIVIAGFSRSEEPSLSELKVLYLFILLYMVNSAVDSLVRQSSPKCCVKVMPFWSKPIKV